MSKDPDRIMNEAISVVEKLVTQSLTTEEMCEVIESAILAAEEREREACAKIAENALGYAGVPCKQAADLIRGRNSTDE